MEKEIIKATDKKIHELSYQIARTRSELEGVTVSLRRLYQQTFDWKTQAWSGTWEWVLRARESLPAISQLGIQIGYASAAKYWQDHDEHQAKLSALRAEISPLHSLYYEHLWSRFYLVVGTGQGHIHKDMDCHSCYQSTQYMWLPELSGDTEEDAVQAEGEILCTFCYPTAPVAWCEGIGRRTKEAKDAAAAVKAERQAAKAAKSLSIDGNLVTIRVEVGVNRYGSRSKEFKTFRSAELWMTEALTYSAIKEMYPDKAYIGRSPDAFSEENIQMVLEMMAAKKEVTVEAIKEGFVKKVAKKVIEEKEWLDRS